MANYMRKLRLDGHLVISPLSRQAEQRQHVEGISIWTKQAGMACSRFYMNTMAALSLWKREIYNKKRSWSFYREKAFISQQWRTAGFVLFFFLESSARKR